MRGEVERKRILFRQGILPPTDPQGRHSEHDPSHEVARAIATVSHEGLLRDFENWLATHRDQSWTTSSRPTSMTRRPNTSHHHPGPTSFIKFMTDMFDAPKAGNAVREKMFSRHFTLPMCPQTMTLCESNIFCYSCLQATPANDHMIHPGPWLNTTAASQRSGTQPVLDLTNPEKRPWSLHSLDADYGKDFAPFVWILAVPPEAQSAHEGVIQHTWDHSLNRWRRFPLSHINDKGTITILDIDDFQRLTNRTWKLRAKMFTEHHQYYTRSETYAQAMSQLASQNPDTSNKQLRQRILKTLNFMSSHTTASFFQLSETQRTQILTTFLNWETHRIQAGLTGLDSNLHEFPHSDQNDTFLFWTMVLPSLHHHFLCRNPECKKVVMSHHWVNTLPQGARKQGRYLCPACLTNDRPFAPQDHKFLKPKQCLVVRSSSPVHEMDLDMAQALQHRDPISTIACTSWNGQRMPPMNC